jgi:hypothetical protein
MTMSCHSVFERDPCDGSLVSASGKVQVVQGACFSIKKGISLLQIPKPAAWRARGFPLRTSSTTKKANMFKLTTYVIALVLWSYLQSASILQSEEMPSGQEGFVTIFDGRTLNGWKAMPSNTAGAWTVKNGMIVGNGDHGRGYLTLQSPYGGNMEVADMELTFSYRFPGKGNSGVSIRAIPDKTQTRRFQSYHADLGHLGIGGNVLGAWDFHTPGRREHRCFRGDRLVIDKDDVPTIVPIEEALTSGDIHKGDWNHVHIIARGNHFQLLINGKLSSEFFEHLPQDKRLKRGMIQLQLHDPGMIVQFKNMQLKILK